MHTNNKYSTLSDDLQKQSHVRNQAANPFRDNLGQEQDKGRSGSGSGGSGEGVFIPVTVSSKYEEAPVPGDTRFASGRNDTEALVPRSEDNNIDQQPSSIEIETRQRPNKLQNEPLIGADKLGVPKSKQD